MLMRLISNVKEVLIIIVMLIFASESSGQNRESLKISTATIMIPSGKDHQSERIMAVVLSEEIEKRIRKKWIISTNWPEKGAVIALSISDEDPGWPDRPARVGEKYAENKPEGYRLFLKNTR